MGNDDRAGDVQKWLEEFQEVFPEAIIATEMDTIPTAVFIEHLYREKLEGSIRPRMKPGDDGEQHRIDRHKIASLYELVVANVSPVIDLAQDTGKSVEDLNADLAYFVAQVVIESFANVKGQQIELNVPASFEREHKSLLKLCNVQVTDGMVFSNAATWYLVEELSLVN